MRALAPISLVAILATLVTIPTVTACSLLYQPFDQARGTDRLHFVDGGALIAVDGNLERTVDEGFFLTYAVTSNGILVAGQDGLGADCSGTRWLRYYEGGVLQWEEAEEARVWPHPQGPIVQREGAFFRFEGGNLVPMDVPDVDEYVIGWTHDSMPVFRDDGGLWIGDRLVAEDASWEPVVAISGTGTLLAWQDEGSAYVLVDGKLATFDAEPNLMGAAWAGGWYVLAGGRAHRVDPAAQTVTDLGRDAVAVGTLGNRALAFHDDGYVAFEGVTPVAAWNRARPLWTPGVVPPANAQVVPSQWVAYQEPEQPESPPGSPPGAEPREDAPGLLGGLGLVAIGAAVALARRR